MKRTPGSHTMGRAPPSSGMAAGLFSRIVTSLAVSWVVLGLLSVVLSLMACLLLLPNPLAVAGLALHLLGLAIPLQWPPPAWAHRFMRFVTASAMNYFPITVEFEDKDAFKTDRPFVVGYEPHSVLPLGACMFMPYAEGMPPCLSNSRMAATSTIFLVPLMRHLLYWMGGRSASREVLQQVLAEGNTVVLCPGGVQECFYMDPQPDREVAFLRSRTGFVRLAIQAGCAIVPVFAFGQTPHYSYFRPFIDFPKRIIPPGTMGSFVRRIGYVPLLAFGVLGSCVPRKVPMHIYVGKPIEVPHQADPSREEVQQYLEQYISALQGIFERGKAVAGQPNATLTII